MKPEARVLSDAGHYRECLLSILNSASSEILIEYYIFADDEFGASLLQVLERRAREGVAVKLLVDGFGSRQLLTTEPENLSQLPFSVRVYHPVPWSLPWSFHTLRQAMRRWREFLYCLGTANRRNHRKVVVVDGEKAIMGSHNAWNESLDWHEISLLLSGACVGSVRESFERIWVRSSDLEGRRERVGIRHRFALFARQNEAECKAGILDNTTVRRSRVRSRTILRLVAHAESRLWIATPYLLPHRTMLKHIRKRAEDGVDVRLILPRRTDQRPDGHVCSGRSAITRADDTDGGLQRDQSGLCLEAGAAATGRCAATGGLVEAPKYVVQHAPDPASGSHICFPGNTCGCRTSPDRH